MTERDIIMDGEPDAAAAELALGLLEGEERAAALRRLLAEPGFAREVERWRAHFANLFGEVSEVAPPPGLEQRVMDRIDGRDGTRGTVSQRFWKPLAIGASIAASLFGVLLVRPEPGPVPVAPAAVQPAPMVAAFTIEGVERPVVATYDASRRTLKMPGPMPVPAGRDAQLWAIVGEQAPRPLGLFREAGDMVMADTMAEQPFAAGTTFAISIEPEGGSPTGAPTGPVVASGTLSEV